MNAFDMKENQTKRTKLNRGKITHFEFIIDVIIHHQFLADDDEISLKA
jgi:hypothetical protein